MRQRRRVQGKPNHCFWGVPPGAVENHTLAFFLVLPDDRLRGEIDTMSCRGLQLRGPSLHMPYPGDLR